jgi:hypothetical protein
MRTIKTYSKRAPFYNAFSDTNPFIGTNPSGELITSGLPVIQAQLKTGCVE